MLARNDERIRAIRLRFFELNRIRADLAKQIDALPDEERACWYYAIDQFDILLNEFVNQLEPNDVDGDLEDVIEDRECLDCGRRYCSAQITCPSCGSDRAS